MLNRFEELWLICTELCRNIPVRFGEWLAEKLHHMYTEAKVDVTQEIEQRAHQAAQAGADQCALCSISCVQI